MTRRTDGPRRSDSPRTYVRSTRIIGGLSVLVFAGAVVWDFANDGFWVRHTLLTSLVASLIVVAVTVAVLNEVLERRQRQRWSVLAQVHHLSWRKRSKESFRPRHVLVGLGNDHQRGDLEGREVGETARLSTLLEEQQ